MISIPKLQISICPLCNQPIDEKMRNEFTSLYLRQRPLSMLYKLTQESPRVLNHKSFRISYTALRGNIISIRTALKDSGSSWKIITQRNKGYYAKKDLD